MTNRLKTEPEPKPRKKKSKVSRTLHSMMSGDFLTRQGVVKSMPFILFVTGLFLLYISIGYTFENTLRDQAKTKKELDELTARFNAVKSDLEKRKQQSSVAREIDRMGLKEPQEQPKVILVDPGYFEKQK